MVKRFGSIAASLGAALVGMGLLAACGTDPSDLEQQVAGLQAQVQQQDEQLRSVLEQLESAQGPSSGASVQPTLMVNPAFFKYPSAKTGPGGLWFYGSGLEPGQWYTITIEGDGNSANVDALSGNALRQANETGAFAVTLAAIRPVDGHPLDKAWGRRGGVLVAKLWDTDTDVLLASTPFVMCGSDGENEWCDAALDSAVVPEVAVGGPAAAPTGTVYTLAEMRLRDGLFELRMGDTTAWGYNAGDRPRSGPYQGEPGQDIVMTINVGDSIVFPDGLVSSGSSSTATHYFTIAELDINEAIPIGLDTNFGFTIAPTEPGEYRIYCSAHPDDHGNVTLVVL